MLNARQTRGKRLSHLPVLQTLARRVDKADENIGFQLEQYDDTQDSILRYLPTNPNRQIGPELSTELKNKFMDIADSNYAKAHAEYQTEIEKWELVQRHYLG